MRRQLTILLPSVNFLLPTTPSRLRTTTKHFDRAESHNSERLSFLFSLGLKNQSQSLKKEIWCLRFNFFIVLVLAISQLTVLEFSCFFFSISWSICCREELFDQFQVISWSVHGGTISLASSQRTQLWGGHTSPWTCKIIYSHVVMVISLCYKFWLYLLSRWKHRFWRYLKIYSDNKPHQK